MRSVGRTDRRCRAGFSLGAGGMRRAPGRGSRRARAGPRQAALGGAKSPGRASVGTRRVGFVGIDGVMGRARERGPAERQYSLRADRSSAGP
jgi:hypothetical protein